ncbi:disease resistance protein RPP2A-like [Brassica napus]|uniref:disease resistance protein RPP2A-like n=1 Tax=Brassica napus TaxID=3708 RepID=UPI002078B0F8|nr:disease resistance protein RPP2A-like [Brassica napus]
MLKSELRESPKPVIITGAALGGSVASLFTLWLLEAVDRRQKLPLCITFGSPLIGDASLQQILNHSVMNSCFLHVVDDAARSPITEDLFKPFGMFLICFGSECICIDDPEAVLELLNGVNADLVGWTDYGEVIKRLRYSSMAESSLMIDDIIIDRMEGRARKKKLRFDLLNKVNDIKIGMIYLDRYVKQSKKSKICSYDCFKTQTIFPYSQFRNELNDFFKSVVENIENMPRKEKSVLKTISLFAGNNYRRLVEPFDIAEHYLSGRKEYRTTGRSRHYVMLEKWLNELFYKSYSHRPGKDLSDLITVDSCFWAEVEEAIIVINLLKTNVGMKHEELIGKLARFEEYVWEMILKSEVSPEIFWEKSSFMRWWKEYKEIKGRYGFDSTPSPFIEFMNSEMYKNYGLPFTKDNIDDLETAPSPGDRLNTFKEEVCLKVRDDSLQVFFFEIYLLDYDKNPDEKSKALNTISKISGVFPTVEWFEEIKLIVFATMDPIETVEKLGKYWNAEIVNVWRSKKAEPNKESSKEQSEKQVEVSVKTKEIKDGRSVLSGSGCIIATVRGKSSDTALSMRNPNDDWSSFCEFLSTHQPPLNLSECRAENVIDFLRMQQASGDVEALAGHLSAMCEAYDIKLKENPFHSLAVTRYVEEVTRESQCILIFYDSHDVDEPHFMETILKELHERELTPLTYNLSGRETLDTELLDRSSVGVVVLSNNYSCSSESLAHLVAIMEHWQAEKFVTTPVHFRVTLSDTGLEEVRLKCLNPIQADRVQNWKAAMAEIPSVHGHGWTKGTQVMLAKEVVRNTCLRLDLKKYTNLARAVAYIKSLKPSDVEIVGLWGMAGIGKTSIAREIYGLLAPDYDMCYFLQDFYLTCQKKGMMQMRDDFLSKVFGEEKLSISACDIKPSFMRHWFHSKKILLVLDDVSNASDAEAVVGGFSWISHGHRIILTSRRKQVLVQCKVQEPYEIRRLCQFESSRLCKQYLNGESEVIKELVSCSSGIPLSLEVLGSSVSKQRIKDMKKHLQSLRRNPPTQIQETFRRSFDGLDGNQKNIFLDLACFFSGENKDHVVQLLDACGFLTNLGICDLIDESLITLVDNAIEMPIPFQDFGRFIVLEEDEDPCERSRLWDSDDITYVLTKNSGTEAIEGIFLDASDLTFENFIKLSPTVFDNMYGLRLLKFYDSTSGNQCKLSLPDGLDMLPDELRLLHWEHYPLEYLPEEFIPENLVELNMPYSNMEKLWEEKKNLKKLKKIRLSNSRNLTDILMLSEALNLEDIDLEGCTSLVDISTSIPRCGKLVTLNMKNCSGLRTLPAMMVDLTSLKLLNLSGCSELDEVQDFAPNLKELYLAGTAIRELPLSTENLTNLATLDLENCSRLQQLPSGIRNSKSIVELKLSGCTNLESLP